LARELVERLSAGRRQFAAAARWQVWLEQVGVTAKRHVRIATEGALVGQILEPGVAPDLLILSDGAAQFDLLVHASCGVHAERPLQRAVPYNEAHRAALAQLRQQIWELYQDLKAYRQRPDPAHKPALQARFEAWVGQQTDYPTSIGSVRTALRDHQADRLRVLERPEVPLPNNGTESILREYVTTRPISGSTRSDAGRRCRDTFASLKKTCRKLAVSFWNYLKDRLRGLGTVPRLADLIRQRAAEARSAVPAEAVSP
jgi:hypothetical protein